MPGYPDGVAGKLVSLSDGDFPINGAWRAEAGICPANSTVEVYTEDLRDGTAIVLHFPDSQMVGTYTVLPADTGLSEERVARLGAQVFRENEAYGFHAIDGHVEVSENEGLLSGRFQSTLKETQIELLTRYVGVFLRIPLQQLPEDYCMTVRDSLEAVVADADSGGVAPDTIVGGS